MSEKTIFTSFKKQNYASEIFQINHLFMITFKKELLLYFSLISHVLGIWVCITTLGVTKHGTSKQTNYSKLDLRDLLVAWLQDQEFTASPFTPADIPDELI